MRDILLWQTFIRSKLPVRNAFKRVKGDKLPKRGNFVSNGQFFEDLLYRDAFFKPTFSIVHYRHSFLIHAFLPTFCINGQSLCPRFRYFVFMADTVHRADQAATGYGDVPLYRSFIQDTMCEDLPYILF